MTIDDYRTMTDLGELAALTDEVRGLVDAIVEAETYDLREENRRLIRRASMLDTIGGIAVMTIGFSAIAAPLLAIAHFGEPMATAGGMLAGCIAIVIVDQWRRA